LREAASSPDFWNNQRKAQAQMSDLARIERILKTLERLERDIGDADELMEMFADDPGAQTELAGTLDRAERDLRELEVSLVLSDPNDTKTAIMTIHPGAGGVESCDWAEMLFRMYMRYFERVGYKAKVLDLQPGEVAGLKDVTIEVSGDYAYGMLKGESGIHRLVRISPFDSGKRRHTSFTSVFVMPEMEEVEVTINPDDLRIDTFRASGHGGQNVNKLSTAVRITHIPTGIVVQCQNERSQHQNKENAMKILRARVYAHEEEKRAREREKLEETKTDIAWGHQIRSYVLFPYQMIKDHRTEHEEHNVDAVLDGEIDEFLTTTLLWQAPPRNTPP
jgi:peptide chain release factor 2